MPVNKILKFRGLATIVTSAFQEDKKYYPQISLYECLYELETAKVW